MSLDRGRAWRIFGAPTDQVGSVNDPRTHEEYGVKWNEKWVYLGEDGKTVERKALMGVVYVPLCAKEHQISRW